MMYHSGLQMQRCLVRSCRMCHVSLEQVLQQWFLLSIVSRDLITCQIHLFLALDNLMTQELILHMTQRDCYVTDAGVSVLTDHTKRAG